MDDKLKIGDEDDADIPLNKTLKSLNHRTKGGGRCGGENYKTANNT